MKNVKRLIGIILTLSMCLCCFGSLGVTASEAVTQESYEPGKPMAIWDLFTDESNANKAGIRLAWVNPTASTLKSIKVYGDSTYGENKFDTLLTTIENPVAGAVEEYFVKGADDAGLTTAADTNNWHTFRVVFDFGDRTTDVLLSSRATGGYDERILRAGTGTQSKVYITGWLSHMPVFDQVIENNGTDTYLKINNLAKTNDRQLNLAVGAGKLTDGTSYNVKISYKSKTAFSWGGFNFAAADDWTTAEQTMTATGNGVVLQTYGISSFTDFCIKSIEVYTIPAEGEDAVLADSYEVGASSHATADISAVGGVTTSLLGNELSFNITASPTWVWQEDGSVWRPVNRYNIYEVINGVRYLRAGLAKVKNGISAIPVTLHNVPDGVHKYEITCSTEIGRESEAKSIKVTVLPYEPKNAGAIKGTTAAENKINVSWINPSATSLSKVSVYGIDPETGVSALLSDSLDTTPNKVVEYMDTLSEAGLKNYRILFEYSDGHQPVEVYVAGETSTATEVRRTLTKAPAEISSYTARDMTTNVPVTSFKLEEENGNHYIKYTTNIADGSDEKTSLYFVLDTKFDGDWQNNYTLKFKAKSENEVKFDIYGGEYADNNNLRSQNNVIPASDEWTELSYTVTHYWQAGNIFLGFKGAVEGLCIDDVTLTHPNGTKHLERDFESNINTAFITPPTGAVAKGKSGAAELNIAQSEAWYVGAADASDSVTRIANRYNIYEDVNGTRVLRATVAKPKLEVAIPTVTLSGLTNEKTYTYYVTCADNNGTIESAPVSVTVTPTDKLKVSDFGLYQGSSTKTKIKANMKYAVKVSVVNGTAASQDAQLILAYYEDGALKSVVKSDKQTITSGGSYDFSEDVAIPSTAGDTSELKCFIWNAIDGLTPLNAAGSYKTK